MSTGHLKPVLESPGTVSPTPLPTTPGSLSKLERFTVSPMGTAPGCHVVIAFPSIVPTFPATPWATVCEPAKSGGSGARATTADLLDWADAAPPVPDAVTTTTSVESRSSGVVVYVERVAHLIAAQLRPLVSQRCQR